jgi:hypothetical protein
LVNVAGGDSLRELWLDAKLSAMVNVHSASALVFVRRSDGNVCNLQIVYKLHTAKITPSAHYYHIKRAAGPKQLVFTITHKRCWRKWHDVMLRRPDPNQEQIACGVFVLLSALGGRLITMTRRALDIFTTFAWVISCSLGPMNDVDLKLGRKNSR